MILRCACVVQQWQNNNYPYIIFFRLGESSKYGSVNEDVFMSTTPTMTGAFVRQPSNGSGKLVYCIHGKPSGCCATLQVATEDTNSNHETSDPVDAKPPITICKYPSAVYLTKILRTYFKIYIMQIDGMVTSTVLLKIRNR